MNLVPKLLLFVLAVAGAGGWVRAADAPPRLWEITGKNEQGVAGKFYILPVTHNGLDVEYDDYFYKTVLPTALQVDVLLQESAIILPSEMPACPRPLVDTAENREIIRQAFIDTERAEYDRGPHFSRTEVMTEQDWVEVQQAERWFAHDTVSKLTEYGLIASMGESLHNFLSKNPDMAGKVSYRPRPDVADYLQHQRWMKGAKSNESIDLSRDLAAAYCSIEPAARGRYLQREIGRFDPLKFKPMSSEIRQRSNVGFIESIKNAAISEIFTVAQTDEYDRHIVCDRNEKWLKKMRDAIGIGVRFYAVGMAHVLQPSARDQQRCDGLLKRLREEGFSVKLVNQ